MSQTKLPFITLLLLISFASVNAVLFTPALPDIANFFLINEDKAQQTISWFLIGYALGQLVYGPLANRLGRKNALYLGIGIQIASSLLCIFSGIIQVYGLLLIGRFMLALGSGVGLKMTFTLVNECYEPKIASQKISYLMLAFAITPGLGVALGGYLNSNWGWISCFYASTLYGLILLFLVSRLRETQTTRNLNALKINCLLYGYGAQFKNRQLILGGLLMGASTAFIYVFASLAPFIAMNLYGMSSDAYGMANCIPSIGMILGSLVSARLAKNYPFERIIRMGLGITVAGVVWMLIAMEMNLNWFISLFFPMVIIYFGLCFILANASTVAMSQASDKSHGASVMSFINMGFATFFVFSLSLFPIKSLLLPVVYLILSILMLRMVQRLAAIRENQKVIS